MGLGADFERLTVAVEKLFLVAILAAFGSLAILIGIVFTLGGALAGLGGGGVFAMLVATIFFHAVFIAALTWRGIRPKNSFLGMVWNPGMAAGALLTVPILAFAVLDMIKAGHCPDGRLAIASAVPNWPWSLIGWFVLTLFALPARFLGFAIGEQPRLIPIHRRLVLMIPFLPVIGFLGAAFQRHLVACEPPYDAFSYGLFEGGMILIPLLGLFWFFASFSMAALSSAFVAPVAAVPEEEAAA